ncbi:hypothetical protein JHK85_026298 [Glycine max]|nr:hypothetical protein JHK87_025621 [Glycine soja]KAG5007756.1 hypothetical protein JHK85_026298 [Glycine max]
MASQAEIEHPKKAFGWAARDPSGLLSPFNFSRSIGGMKETQEMIDFAAEHYVKPDIEVIPVDYVNTAMEHLL